MVQNRHPGERDYLQACSDVTWIERRESKKFAELLFYDALSARKSDDGIDSKREKAEPTSLFQQRVSHSGSPSTLLPIQGRVRASVSAKWLVRDAS